MVSARTPGAALFGALAGAWIGRAIFAWILDVARTGQIVAMIVLAALGALLCAAGEIEERQKRE
jgi:hypothetical protein